MFKKLLATNCKTHGMMGNAWLCEKAVVSQLTEDC